MSHSVLRVAGGLSVGRRHRCVSSSRADAGMSRGMLLSCPAGRTMALYSSSRCMSGKTLGCQYVSECGTKGSLERALWTIVGGAIGAPEHQTTALFTSGSDASKQTSEAPSRIRRSPNWICGGLTFHRISPSPSRQRTREKSPPSNFSFSPCDN